MAKTTLYTGTTGCGKTYKAITENASFTIAVPCRQLAYGLFMDYPTRISRISTGEVHMGGAGNEVCVYENLPFGVIPHKTLIVDEAHHLNDRERGGALFEQILKNQAAGKDVILLTATDTLSDEVKSYLRMEAIELPPFCDVPKKVRLEFPEFCRKVEKGMSTIVFTKYVPTQEDIDNYSDYFSIDDKAVGILSANTPGLERLETQLAFKEGRLQVVISSNVIAQGLNFLAEGVFIEYNEYDDWEVVTQKVGRVARPLSGLSEGYYCLHHMPDKYKNEGIPQHLEKMASQYWRPSGAPVDIVGWGFMDHEVPLGFFSYREYKYSYRFLVDLKRRLGTLEPSEQFALHFLEQQSAQLTDLLSRKRIA